MSYLHVSASYVYIYTYIYIYACIYVAHLRTFVTTGALDIMRVALWGLGER